MKLCELAAGYRQAAELIRHRIQEVEELPARTREERRAKRERLRMLKAMARDARDVAVICERYYEKGYHINERYSLS